MNEMFDEPSFEETEDFANYEQWLELTNQQRGECGEDEFLDRAYEERYGG